MKLFKDYECGPITFKNRLVMAPMCQYSCMNHDGIVSLHHTTHYQARAIGQVGYIVVEATGVSPEGRITDQCLGLWNDVQKEAFRPLVANVQELGSKIGIQLNHAGRKCTAIDGVDTIYAPSAIAFDENSKTPNELSYDEIQSVFKDFKDAAQRAADVGFDALEIHGAHGYLISQFISPITNKRNDKYADPSVFLSELLDEIEMVWPKDRMLSIRISATDYEEDGYDVDDIIEILRPVKDRFDIIHVSSGGITPIRPTRLHPGYQVPFATRIKEVLDVPVIACGLITELDLVSDILENDRADLVAMGRLLLSDPQWLLTQANKRRRNDLIPVQYQRAYK